MSTGANNRVGGGRTPPPPPSAQPSSESADEMEPRGNRCCGKTVAERESMVSGAGGSSEVNGCCGRCVDRCAVCTATMTRICLIIPNLVFLLFGGTLIGLGVWMKADRDSSFYLEVLRTLPASPLVTFERFPVVIIAVGSCVAILSFLGCCGACAESICFLCLYMLLIVIVLIAEIVLGIVFVVMRNEILLKLESNMQNQIRYEYNATDLRKANDNRTFNHLFTEAWDKMQTEFSCCGAIGPEDYQDSAWYNRTKSSDPFTLVPVSCCHVMSQPTKTNCQLEAYHYFKTPASKESSTALKTQGCRQSMIDLVQQNLTVIIGVVSSVAMLQMADFVFACVLIRFVRKKQESWYEDEIDYANNDCAD